MATLNVRNLDDELVQALKQRAARHGRSAEAEHREILRAALRGERHRASWEERAAALRAATVGRSHTPAEVLIRESRDER